MKCERMKKFLASTKREPGCISRGFTCRKEGMSAVKKHASSDCHREAVQTLIVLPSPPRMSVSCRMLSMLQRKRGIVMLVLINIRFLTRQGLALRVDGDELNSNFTQLLHLRANECRGVDVGAWLERRANKYTSPEVQNECLQLMALHILHSVSRHIAECPCYSVMADECTDCSNKEQFTVCIRWEDEELKEHEDFIVLYQVDTIDADCLLSVIRDVLLQMNMKLAQCCGQCYDGTSNMSGTRGGVARKIADEESRALYTHCYSHALNLAVSDTVKKSQLCKDALDTAFEVIRLITFSPKGNVAFEKIRSSQQDTPSPVGIRTFCKNRWTVRGDALESILLN